MIQGQFKECSGATAVYIYIYIYIYTGARMVKNPPVNAGDITGAASIPGSERLPGGGNSNPLQDSCLENRMDRGAWRTTVHRLQKAGHD